MTHQMIDDIFTRMQGLKALVIGDVMLDSYIWGRVDRISPEAPVPVVSVTRREVRPGGAANVALNLHALGAVPVICTVTGNDARGNEFKQLMESMGLSTAGQVQSNERVTTTKFRIIGNNYQMLRVDEESDRPLSESETQLFCKHIQHIIESGKPAVIIFEDYDKGVINPEVIGFVTGLAKKMNIPVTADPKKRNFAHYRDITLFKPNLKEMIEGLKTDRTDLNQESLSRLAQSFFAGQACDYLLLTLSEHGVFIAKRNGELLPECHLIPAQVRQVADVSGAGDTVISIASLCLALGVSPYHLAFAANIGGGLVCEEVGVVPVDATRLRNELFRLLGAG